MNLTKHDYFFALEICGLIVNFNEAKKIAIGFALYHEGFYIGIVDARLNPSFVTDYERLKNAQ
jgi:hypothetical protein